MQNERQLCNTIQNLLGFYAPSDYLQYWVKLGYNNLEALIILLTVAKQEARKAEYKQNTYPLSTQELSEIIKRLRTIQKEANKLKPVFPVLRLNNHFPQNTPIFYYVSERQQWVGGLIVFVSEQTKEVSARLNARIGNSKEWGGHGISVPLTSPDILKRDELPYFISAQPDNYEYHLLWELNSSPEAIARQLSFVNFPNL